MATFHGTLRLAAEPDAVHSATVIIVDDRFVLRAAGSEVGDWPLRDLHFSYAGEEIRVRIDDDDALLSMPERGAFAAAVGLSEPLGSSDRDPTPAPDSTGPKPVALDDVAGAAGVAAAAGKPPEESEAPSAPDRPDLAEAPVSGADFGVALQPEAAPAAQPGPAAADLPEPESDFSVRISGDQWAATEAPTPASPAPSPPRPPESVAAEPAGGAVPAPTAATPGVPGRPAPDSPEPPASEVPASTPQDLTPVADAPAVEAPASPWITAPPAAEAPAPTPHDLTPAPGSPAATTPPPGSSPDADTAPRPEPAPDDAPASGNSDSLWTADTEPTTSPVAPAPAAESIAEPAPAPPGAPDEHTPDEPGFDGVQPETNDLPVDAAAAAAAVWDVRNRQPGDADSAVGGEADVSGTDLVAARLAAQRQTTLADEPSADPGPPADLDPWRGLPDEAAAVTVPAADDQGATDAAPSRTENAEDQRLERLRAQSTASYFDDDTLRKWVAWGLLVGGLVIGLGAFLTWGDARIFDTEFPVGRVLAAVSALAAIIGFVLGFFMHHRTLGAYVAGTGAVLGLMTLFLYARAAGIGSGFFIALLGVLVVAGLAVLAITPVGGSTEKRTGR